MPIGNGPDYYNGKNKIEEEQLRLKEKADKWWYGLVYHYKFELLEPYYPDKLHLMRIDEAWNGLDWNDKWDIYRGEHDEVMV